MLILALTALHDLHRGRDYEVDPETRRLVLIDPETGQHDPGRNWGSGVQQMVEVMEGLPPSPVNRSVAQISVPAALDRFALVGGIAAGYGGAGSELYRTYRTPCWPGGGGTLPVRMRFAATAADHRRHLAALAEQGTTLVSARAVHPAAITPEAALAAPAAGPAGTAEIRAGMVFCDVPPNMRLPEAIAERSAAPSMKFFLCMEDPALARGALPVMVRRVWRVLPLRQLVARTLVERAQKRLQKQDARMRRVLVEVEGRRKKMLAFAGAAGQ